MANLPLDDSRKAAIGGKSTSTGLVIPISAIPLTGANAAAVAIVDASGNQITSFGGGTQYTDGGTPPANPVGNTLEWNEGGTWRTVSTAKPLPVTATFSPSGTQDVNLTKVAGTAFALGQALAAASLPVVLTAAQIITLTPPTSVTVTQATGTNLHAVLDTTSTTAVTQATGTNLHMVVDSGTVSTVTNVSQNGGVAISLNAGAVDTGTRRVVQANGAGKTILSTGGSASTSGNNTLVAAGTNKLKVFAFSLSTLSTTAMTCIFQSGASGTELWRVILQAGTSVSTGANLTVAPPAWLFATASATLLNLNLSSANAVHWSVSYYDEA